MYAASRVQRKATAKGTPVSKEKNIQSLRSVSNEMSALIGREHRKVSQLEDATREREREKGERGTVNVALIRG